MMIAYIVTVFNSDNEKCNANFGMFPNFEEAKLSVEKYLKENRLYDEYSIEKYYVDSIGW